MTGNKHDTRENIKKRLHYKYLHWFRQFRILQTHLLQISSVPAIHSPVADQARYFIMADNDNPGNFANRYGLLQ